VLVLPVGGRARSAPIIDSIEVTASGLNPVRCAICSTARQPSGESWSAVDALCNELSALVVNQELRLPDPFKRGAKARARCSGIELSL
jgi:hypothetical protein